MLGNFLRNEDLPFFLNVPSSMSNKVVLKLWSQVKSGHSSFLIDSLLIKQSWFAPSFTAEFLFMEDQWCCTSSIQGDREIKERGFKPTTFFSKAWAQPLCYCSYPAPQALGNVLAWELCWHGLESLLTDSIESGLSTGARPLAGVVG